MKAWVGKLDCGCVVAISTSGEDDFVFEDDADITEVEQTTVADARARLTVAHSRPTCEVLAERDAARAELAVKDEALAEIAALLHHHLFEDASEDPFDVMWKVQCIISALSERISQAQHQYDEGGGGAQ